MGDEVLASRENRHFKEIKRLAEQARSIKLQGKALLDSIHLIQACMAANVPMMELILTEDALTRSEVMAIVSRSPDVPTTLLTRQLFRELTTVVSPIGVAAIIDIPRALSVDDVIDADVLVLDCVQDAGNVGVMLRTAACMGFTAAVLGRGCAGAWIPKTLRSGQGAHFALQLVEDVDLVKWLPQQSLPSIGADAGASAEIYSTDLRSNAMWVFGNEGQGLSAPVKELLTTTVSIPMSNTMESLNVSSAAAICLYESSRQRRFPRQMA